MRTRSVLTTVSALAVLALSGCGGGSGSSGSSGSDDAKLLSKTELKSSLISLDDLGSDFKVDPDEDDDSDADLGCLNGLDKLDDSETQPARDDEASFVADSDLSLPSVLSSVGTFKSEDKAAKVLAEIEDALADCTKVDVTDEDGFRLQLDVSTNSDRVDDGVTDQLNLEAVGTASGEGVEFPFSVRFSAIQLDNQVTVVGYVNAVESLGAEADALLQRAFDRLAPVAEGKKVPDLEPLDLEVIDIQDVLGGGNA